METNRDWGAAAPDSTIAENVRMKNEVRGKTQRGGGGNLVVKRGGS